MVTVSSAFSVVEGSEGLSGPGMVQAAPLSCGGRVSFTDVVCSVVEADDAVFDAAFGNGDAAASDPLADAVGFDAEVVGGLVSAPEFGWAAVSFGHAPTLSRA